jgi:hypothetical protein
VAVRSTLTELLGDKPPDLRRRRRRLRRPLRLGVNTAPLPIRRGTLSGSGAGCHVRQPYARRPAEGSVATNGRETTAALGKSNLGTIANRQTVCARSLCCPISLLRFCRTAVLGALVCFLRPTAGNLRLDGFSCTSFDPKETPVRLDWLTLDCSDTIQPYRQLAKVYQDSGDVRISTWPCRLVACRSVAGGSIAILV